MGTALLVYTNTMDFQVGGGGEFAPTATCEVDPLAPTAVWPSALQRSDDSASSFFLACVDVDLLWLLLLLVLLLLVVPALGAALTVGDPLAVRIGLTEAMPPVAGRNGGVRPQYIKSQPVMIAAVQ